MALAVISLKWVHREIHGKPPSPRQGHSACLVGNVAYIFGGIRSVDWPKRGTYFFRDLYQLHLYKRMQWEKVKQKGEIPKGRYGHHMCVIGHKIYLFGGKHELHADRCLSGLHVYDTEKKTWSQPQTSGTEPIAHGSTSSVVGNRIYVYGGLVDGQAVDDLHCFDSENQWWVKLTIQGVPPSPRCDSASTSVGHEIFVFGGTGGTDQWFNDVHVFNTKKLLWKELNKTDGEPPTPRGSHCFLAHVDKDIYVFGGSNDSNTSHPTLGDLYKFSLDKRKWKRPFYGGCPPAKRSGHAAIIHRNKLIIIGGSNEDTDFNDVHIAKLINPSQRQPLKVPAGDMHDFLDTLNNSDPPPMVVDGEDADAHFHEKEEDPETISKEEEPAGGSEMEQNAGQHQTESPVTGSRDGSVAGSDGDLKGSPGKSVHFEDDGEGKQDGASLSSSAGSLASSAGSLSSSASSSSASSSGSGGSDEQGSSNNNNSNNNNAAADIRKGTSSDVRSRIVPEDGAVTPDGGSEYVETSDSDKRENKGKVEAAGKSNGQMVSENKQVCGPVRSAGQGKPKLAPIAKTEPKPSTKKEGKKAGSQKKKPKKERSDGGLEDDIQTPVPAERRSYPPVDSHLDSHQHSAPEEAVWNHYPGDLRNFNQIHAHAHEPPLDEPESDEEESESEGGSGSGSGSSSEEESDDNDDDDGDDGESEESDDGEDNQSATPDEQSINGNDESLAYRPASQERSGESNKDEAESEDDDGGGSDDDDNDDDDDDDDDSSSDGEEESADGSGSESESVSGSGSEDGSDSEED